MNHWGFNAFLAYKVQIFKRIGSDNLHFDFNGKRVEID